MTHDRQRWEQMLDNLITQGLYQLLEGEVTVKCRKIDLALVQVRNGAVTVAAAIVCVFPLKILVLTVLLWNLP